MRILITGAGGFVGGHLLHFLREVHPEAEFHGTLRDNQQRVADLATCHVLDLKEPQATFDLIESVRPTAIYHLAAQAFVPMSFDDPWETLENNIRAQLNLTQACLKFKLDPRILVIGSAQIYGAVSPEEQPLTENAALRPSSPYSVSKIAQDMLGLQYHLSHQMQIMLARPFNHFGPGQDERFAVPSFALQIARIEAGQQDPIILVGNLEARRDYTDVRDIVRAYHLIIEKGTPGEIYNVAAGIAYSMQEILDGLLQFAKRDIEVRVDPSRLRSVDIPVIQGDSTRLQQATGWKPEISLEQSLQDILEDSRKRIREAANA